MNTLFAIDFSSRKNSSMNAALHYLQGFSRGPGLTEPPVPR